MSNKMKHFKVNCFHCEKELNQRTDTYKRQLAKYGHHCCKNCFGKEQTFKNARREIMLINNPFKGKKHTLHTLNILSELRMGTPAWNKGLNKETSHAVAMYGIAGSISKAGKYSGKNNPNWKGGISKIKRYGTPLELISKWLSFRLSILNRDNKSCWKCEAKKWLEVHHLESQTRFPELVFDEFNCVVLCRPCHLQFHNVYGKKNFNASHFTKWINESRDISNKLCMC